MSYLTIDIASMIFPQRPYVIRHAGMRMVLGLPAIEQTDRLLIEDFHVNVERGAFISIVGESGAGKTTLLRIIAGLEQRFKGEVLLEGARVVAPGRGIQMVFQNHCLLPWRTVRENIAFAATPGNGHSGKGRIDEWIGKTKLRVLAHQYPKTLSGGETGRVALARVFVDPPDVLLLDEPFRSVDPRMKVELQRELCTFVRENATTVVLVSHSIDDAVFLSDYVIQVSKKPMRVQNTIEVPGERGARIRGNAELVKCSTDLVNLMIGGSNTVENGH